jgi:hypothetical protein
MYDDARRAEMVRQARQSQLAGNVERSRDYERRSFLQRAWFWRQRQSGEIPEAAPVVTPP